MQIYRADGSVRTVGMKGAFLAIDPFCFAYTRYARIGAPIDYVLAEDLTDHLGDYKLYVVANCCHADAGFRKAVEALKRRSCTLLWLSAPGYMSPAGNSVEGMRRLTGLRLEKRSGREEPLVTMSDGRKMGSTGATMAPTFSVSGAETLGRWPDGTAGVAAARVGRATSVYCGSDLADLAFLRELAGRAGVHVYSESGDPVEANESLVCLHARTAGRKTVRLPRTADVYDVFNRKVVGKGVSAFSFEAPLHSSWLFAYR